MAHYEDMRQAQAYKQRQEQIERERLTAILSPMEEIKKEMAEIKEEIEKLKKILSSGSKEGWL